MTTTPTERLSDPGRTFSDLPDVFNLLDAVEMPPEEKNPGERKGSRVESSGKRRTLLVTQFRDTVGKFLLKVNDVRSAHKTTWAKIFHERMCHQSNIFNSEKANSLIEIVTFYLLLSTGETNKMTRIAKDILSHLAAHRTDLDGAIIGHRPAVQLRAVVVRQFLSNVKKNIGPFADIVKFLQIQLERITVLNDTEKKKSILRRSSNESPDRQLLVDDLEDTSRENLLNLIISWSKLPDAKEIAKQVISFAELFRGVEDVKEGELVLVLIKKAALPWASDNVDQDRFSGVESTQQQLCKGLEYDIVYARASAMKDLKARTITVFLTPDEDLTDEIPFSFVFPLPQTLIQQMQNVRSMEKLVSVPLDGLIEAISDSVTQETNSFLANQGIDINIVQKCEENSVNLYDLNILKRTAANLLRLSHEPPTEFYVQLSETAHSQILAFKERLHPSMAFMPTKNQVLQSVETFDFGGLARDRIDTYLRVCQEALAKLKITKKELLDGTEKSKLTQWWLHLIESRTEKFLLALGYAMDALPDDYIEKPPKDLEVVKKNLDIIREVLDTKTNKHNTKELISQLCSLIYPVIEDFVRKARFMLSEQFDLHKETELSKYENMLNSKLERTEQVDTWIAELMKDIKHLGKMKRMETAPPSKKSLDIVPISGLIIGRFVRLENELKTAIELWDRPSRKASSMISDTAHLRQMASIPSAKQSAPTKVPIGLSSLVLPAPVISSSSSSLSTSQDQPTILPTKLTPPPVLTPPAQPPALASSSTPAVAASSTTDLVGKIQKVKQDTLPRIHQMEETIGLFKKELAASTHNLASLIALAKCLKENKPQLQPLFEFLPRTPTLRLIKPVEDKVMMLRSTVDSLIEFFEEVVGLLKTAFEQQNNPKDVILLVKAIRAIDLKPPGAP